MSGRSGAADARRPVIVTADDVELLTYLRVFRRYGWLIIGLVVAVALVTAVINLRLPKSYEATASILPQKDSPDLRMAMAGVALGGGGVGDMPGNFGMLTNSGFGTLTNSGSGSGMLGNSA